jgi:hypothetical protein
VTDLIAEDLLLLLLDDESGKLRYATYLDAAIGGALLMDLTLGGMVEVHEDGRRWTSAKVRPTATESPDDEVLAQALTIVAQKERTAQDLVRRLGSKRRDVLLARLAEQGEVSVRAESVLGVFTRTRWPVAAARREPELRRRLGDVLVRGGQPEERTGALVSLLLALGIVHRVIDREGLTAKEIKNRAKEVATGDWASKAVKDAIQSVQAIAAGVAAAGAAAAVSGGS